ncbi:STM4015 family protein [Kitasatospora sp. DSM 101779]|uniref:STM4015 family protein n=1 Tax=Kitasatospora sp. DSM 101779 TaxID=2853165 RepID=UPI0021DAD338|nr:STM4015 family protein [Kitasatospora sp. DSM 101779]MCU7822863.1 STM4015 family protein [Kitasatospora sp. DSM 101779]
MAISKHIEEFGGLPVVDVLAALEDGRELPAADAAAWRIALEYDDARTFAEVWRRFLGAVDAERVTTVVIGNWSQEEPEPLAGPLAEITGAAGRLPALRALFVGDITFEECEISWLQMCDLTPLFESFPRLEELVVRGAGEDWDGNGGLELAPLRHEHLRRLRLEAGGLPGRVVRSVAACDFPALESLELWLGVDNYGGDWTLDDLAPFLAGTRLPALRRLGLQNTTQQDEVCARAAHAPVVARLEHLALSMGALTDEGAAALLEGQPLTHLVSLDLHHHYLTEEMQQRLRQALPGVAIDLSDAQKWDDNWRYVAVSE